VKTPLRVRISHLPRDKKAMTKTNKKVTIAIIEFISNDIINKFLNNLGKKINTNFKKK